MKVVKRILIVFAVVIASLLVLLFLNDKANGRVFVTEYTYTNGKIPHAFQGSKLMVISDLHNAPFAEQIIAHAKKEKPDYVIMTGDMVQLPECEFDNTLKIADAMAEMHIPVYAVSGNHDRQCGGYADIIDHLWAHDVYMLENGSVRLEKNGETINLVGIKDPRHDVVTDEKMNVICGNIQYELSKKDGFSILLSHRADLYPGIKDTGVDLILSGHLHGGIIRLPFVGGLVGKNKEDSLLPAYAYGMYKEGDSATMIVSGGCDKNDKKRRFFNPPEILLITLKGE